MLLLFGKKSDPWIDSKERKVMGSSRDQLRRIFLFDTKHFVFNQISVAADRTRALRVRDTNPNHRTPKDSIPLRYMAMGRRFTVSIHKSLVSVKSNHKRYFVVVYLPAFAALTPRFRFDSQEQKAQWI